MLLNDMNEFTILTVLNAVKKHFLVTIVLFGLTYWLVPGMNFIDNRYSMEKTIILGDGAKGYQADFLKYHKIHAILSSANLRRYLGDNTPPPVARFKVTKNEEGNIVLVLKHANPDSIFKTSTLIMERLQEFDELEIQKQISLIDKDIADIRKSRQRLLLSDENFVINNSDIEEYVDMQIKYDAAFTPFDVDFDVDRQNNSDIFGLTRLKRENAHIRLNTDLKIMTMDKNIMQLEGKINEGYKKVSYLFPASPQEIKKYYPNDIIFFGISLLTAFFYNLIMLNFLYIKYKKSVKSNIIIEA